MTDLPVDIVVRPATAADCDTLVDFNCRLADETEGKSLDRETVTRGVQAVFDDPSKARYFVACDGEQTIGQLMHTWEWSDWRNGLFWWVQSVYVHPDHRRRGVFRRLLEHLRDEAVRDSQVVGLRLYVEQENSVAQEVYSRLGLTSPGYQVLETFLS